MSVFDILQKTPVDVPRSLCIRKQISIVMSAITSVRGGDATKIANLADDVWAIIANDGGEKKDRHSILADLLAIDVCLTPTSAASPTYRPAPD